MLVKTYHSKMNKFGKIICNDCLDKERIKHIYEIVQTFCKEHNYELLTTIDQIKSNQSQIEYICPIHGKQQTKVCSIKANKQCYHCSRKVALAKKSQTTLKSRQDGLFNRAIEAAQNKGYKILTKKEDITKNTDIIEYNCPKHGKHSMRIANFNSGKGCPECVGENNSVRFRLNIEEVINRVKQCGGILLNPEDYINSQVKNLRFICGLCGNEFNSSLSHFLLHGGQKCPNCSGRESMGETKIRKYLEEHNINFTQEKTFPDCMDKKLLRFDFYLEDYNLIIEFDGSQHYKESFEFRDSLENVQNHDKIKNEYCSKNNINLIRIPYWHINNIDKILDKNISHKDIVCSHEKS